VAKIVSGGTTFIRGYGIFPHPNPFSAFLVTGILFTIYLLINSATIKSRVLYSILLFINILGLTVTFSRGAYLALAAGLVIFFGSLWFILPLAEGELEGVKKRRLSAATILLVSLVVSFFLFKPFLITRATFSDQSTIAREFYDVTGIKMAEKNPIFGVGLGESLLQMEKYLPATNFSYQQGVNLNKQNPSGFQNTTNNNQKLEAGEQKALAPWDKQPPHNYFIIAAAEMGIPAMLILVWIFLSHLYKLLKQKLTAYCLLLTAIFICFLILMQFDHYFYTLEQTQLLLWLFLALIATKTKDIPA
jgi:O-antigen ligase